MSITLFLFLYRLTFSVSQLYVKGFTDWLTIKISHVPILGQMQFILLLFNVWKQSSIANQCLLQISFAQRQTGLTKSHNNNINNISHMRRPSPVYENAKCGETALGPQCCRVQQISVSGCKKTNLFYCRNPSCWSWGQVSTHFTSRKRNTTTITI